MTMVCPWCGCEEEFFIFQELKLQYSHIKFDEKGRVIQKEVWRMEHYEGYGYPHFLCDVCGHPFLYPVDAEKRKGDYSVWLKERGIPFGEPKEIATQGGVCFDLAAALIHDAARYYDDIYSLWKIINCKDETVLSGEIQYKVAICDSFSDQSNRFHQIWEWCKSRTRHPCQS